GVRWQEREAASSFPTADGAIPATSPSSPGGLAAEPAGTAAAEPAWPAAGGADGAGASGDSLRLGTYRSIWAAPEVEISPALKFTVARQQVELSPEDAERLGIAPGEAIEVSQNGTRLNAVAHVRTGVPTGTAFLADGLANGSANTFTEPVVEVRKR
ncbi:MAG: hypothetical protein JOZ95_04340, partial [Solirubrobacterales bacterium]|nr:hypothetical protein [Solirubrobacterales bacterium]